VQVQVLLSAPFFLLWFFEYQMKKTLVLLLMITALVGCRTRYDITLSNGSKISGVSKPQLDRNSGYYVFTEASGKTNFIPSMRVSLIEPQRFSEEESSPKKPKSKGVKK
jgi:hypothetical protein